MAPAISIIIPCYRAQGTIAETVEAVLGQTVTDWECILVSDDGTSYLEHLNAAGIEDPRVIEHPERSEATGTVAPRNRGLALATGRFIADLDADDVWKPHRLERLLPVAERYGCAQDILECFDDGSILGLSDENADGTVEALGVAEVTAMHFPFHLVVRRDRLGDLWSAYDSWAPDVIRTMLLASTSPIGFLREALLRYRVHPGSMSQSRAGAQKIDAAYEDILQRLEHGDGFGLAEMDCAAAINGVKQKRSLNLRYLSESENLRQPLPFLSWLLARRQSENP